MNNGRVTKEEAFNGINKLIDILNGGDSLTSINLKMLTIVLMGHGKGENM